MKVQILRVKQHGLVTLVVIIIIIKIITHASGFNILLGTALLVSEAVTPPQVKAESELGP